VAIPNLQSLSGRNIWVFGIVLAMLILIGGGLGIWDMRRRTIEEASGDMRNLGVVLAEQSTRYVQVIDLLLLEMQMRSRELAIRTQEGFRRDLGDENIHRFLVERLKNLPQARATGLFDADGILVNTSHDTPIPRFSIADRDYFQYVRDHANPDVFVSVPAKDRGSGPMSIFLARRISGPDGAFLGAVVASVNVDYLLDFYHAIGPDRHIAVTLIRRDGIVLARYPQLAMVGQPMSVALPWYALVAAGGGTYRASGIFTGAETIVAVSPLRDYPLVIDVSMHEVDALALWWQQAAYMACAEATLAAAFVTLFWMAARQMRRQQQHNTALSHNADALRDSEGRLRNFAELASDWFWEQDAELRFAKIGFGSPLHHGDDRSYVGGRRWELNDTSREPEKWEKHRHDVQSRQKFLDFRYDRVGVDGQVHHVSISGMPAYDGAGAFAGYRGIGRDITAQIEAEQELHRAKDRAEQAEALLRDAVDSISEGFVIFDHEDRFVMCNEAYRQIYSEGAALMVPGAYFEDIVRHVRSKGGGNADWRRNEAEGLAIRLRHRRDADGAMEHRLDNGSWILVTDRRMKNGGIAGLRINITNLKQTKAALYQSEERLDHAQAIAGIGSWELDVATGRYLWSKEMSRIRGLSPEEIDPDLNSIAPYVHPEDDQSLRHWIGDLAAGAGQGTHELRIVRPGGDVRVLSIEGRAMTGPDGVVRRVAGTAQDITDRRLIEQQLAQARKMEAIGNVTGGMAHDFNNGLGVIIGNLDLLGRLIKADPMATELCDEARDGAHRCTDLIRLLLAFARRQPLRPRQTNVNALAERTVKLLSRTLGGEITVTLHLCTSLSPVVADPAQLEAALTNLVNNARDAMPRGGSLDITTKSAELDAQYAALHPEAKPGVYVLIEVSDTGTGIAPDVIGRIFEPFFTTKELGRGSGLGLSMVFGFVRQSGGHLAVYSEPGRGSTFRIYLPRAQTGDAQTGDAQTGDAQTGDAQTGDAQTGNAQTGDAQTGDAQTGDAPAGDAPAVVLTDRRPTVGGDETVLMVEDNARLRQVTARHLAGLGYQVREAEHAAAALVILSSEERVDLLFTDLVMPGAMDGLDLAQEATRLRPGLKILLTSGFAGLRGGNQRMEGCPFVLLSKPYGHDELSRTIREVLDRDEKRAPAAAAHPAVSVHRIVPDGDRAVTVGQVS
jgi:PAS domain S-box-containing protein